VCKKKSFDYYAFLLVLFSLPFGKSFTLPIFLIWLCLLIISYIVKRDFSIDRFKSVLLLPIILFFLLVVGFSLSPNLKAYFSEIQLKIPLLLVPLLYPYQREPYRSNHRYFLWFFVIGCTFASIYYFGYAIYRSFSLVNDVWIFNPTPTYGWNNYFFSTEFSYLIHPSYFALYLLVSLLIIGNDQNLWLNKSNEAKLIIVLIALSLVTSLIFLQSRAGVFSFGLLLIVWLLYNVFVKHKYKLGVGVLTVLLCLGFLVISKFDRIAATVKSFEITTDLGVKDQYKEDATVIRLWIWKSSFSAIADHPLWGVGPSNVKEVLLKEYLKRDMRTAASEKMNAHNQYLETWLGMGLFGFLILLAMFIVPIWYGILRRDWFLLGLLCLVSFSFMFESMLERVAGVVFFALFYTIFVSRCCILGKKEVR